MCRFCWYGATTPASLIIPKTNWSEGEGDAGTSNHVEGRWIMQAMREEKEKKKAGRVRDRVARGQKDGNRWNGNQWTWREWWMNLWKLNPTHGAWVGWSRSDVGTSRQPCWWRCAENFVPGMSNKQATRSGCSKRAWGRRENPSWYGRQSGWRHGQGTVIRRVQRLGEKQRWRRTPQKEAVTRYPRGWQVMGPFQKSLVIHRAEEKCIVVDEAAWWRQISRGERWGWWRRRRKTRRRRPWHGCKMKATTLCRNWRRPWIRQLLWAVAQATGLRMRGITSSRLWRSWMKWRRC